MKIIALLFMLAAALPAAERARTCRILFPGGPQQAASKYYIFDGKSSQEVLLPRLSLSPVYKLAAGDVKIRLLTSPVLKPEDIPAGVPEINVPADVRDIYLLLSDHPDNKVLPLKLSVVNANEDKIRLGEMQWFNMTQKHLAGKVGKSSLNLQANSSVVVNEPASSAGDYPVEIYFRVPGDERTHPLIEGQWYHDPRSRFIVFVYDDGNRRAPRVMSVSDFRVAETKEDE